MCREPEFRVRDPLAERAAVYYSKGRNMATETDPGEAIDRSDMTMAQVTVVAIVVLLNAMDGFDILSIAFASNGIAAEWKVTTQALGIVLSMELIGMAVGS